MAQQQKQKAPQNIAGRLPDESNHRPLRRPSFPFFLSRRTHKPGFLRMPQLLQPPLSLHRLGPGAKLFSVHEPLRFVYPRVPGTSAVHVTPQPSIHVPRVPSVEATVITKQNINIIRHKTPRRTINPLKPKINPHPH